VSRYQRGRTNLDFTEATDSEWQWHQLGYMQLCTSLQTNNHASTPPLKFLQAECPSCRPTNSVKALKAQALKAMATITEDLQNMQTQTSGAVEPVDGSGRAWAPLVRHMQLLMKCRIITEH